MRSADPRVRLGSVTAMEKGDPALTRAFLIEATRDADVSVRVAACRVLASRANRPPGLVPILSQASKDFERGDSRRDCADTQPDHRGKCDQGRGFAGRFQGAQWRRGR